MASYNKVMLMGNLVRDPELRVTPSGLSICRFTLASSRSVKSEKVENGVREETTFVDVEVFGKQAEIVAKYFIKGRPIFVEGRLRLNEWQTQTGEKRSKLIVVLENFVFVSSNTQQTEGRTSTPFAYEKVETKVEPENTDTPFSGAEDEDVPF